MSQLRNAQDPGGFTLVELLVVIAVLGVLIALLLPALGRVKEQTRRTVCQQHERQIVLAELMYARENEGWYMYFNPFYPPRIAQYSDGSDGGKVKVDLRPHFDALLGTPDLFYCPSDVYKAPDFEGGWNFPRYLNPIHYLVEISYNLFAGFSAYYNWGHNVIYPGPPFPYRNKGIFHEEEVAEASAVPALADFAEKESPHPPGRWRHVTPHARDDSSRSPEGVNTAYLDGHVQWEKFDRVDINPNPGVADPNHFVLVYYSEMYFKGGG